MKINIAIIDDHPTFRKSLVLLLQKAATINIVGEADNGQEALALITAKKPDIALTDFHMPMGAGPDGLALIEQAKKVSPNTKLIIITGEHNPYLLSLMLYVGADSLILKNDAHQTDYTLKVIERTHQGKNWLTRQEELNAEINQATAKRERFIGLMNDTELRVIFLFSEEWSKDSIAKAVKKSTDYIPHILRQAREKYNKSYKLNKNELLKNNDQLKALYKQLFPQHYQVRK